jgi:hypothetical protein
MPILVFASLRRRPLSLVPLVALVLLGLLLTPEHRSLAAPSNSIPSSQAPNAVPGQTNRTPPKCVYDDTIGIPPPNAEGDCSECLKRPTPTTPPPRTGAVTPRHESPPPSTAVVTPRHVAVTLSNSVAPGDAQEVAASFDLANSDTAGMLVAHDGATVLRLPFMPNENDAVSPGSGDPPDGGGGGNIPPPY